VDVVSAHVEPQAEMAVKAAKKLEELGFRVRGIGGMVAVEAPAHVWREVFGVEFEQAERRPLQEIPEHAVPFLRPKTSDVTIPSELRELVRAVYFAEPPTFFG